MTTTTDTKPCSRCGKPFKRSKADYTVNCPACRSGAQQKSKQYKPVACGQCGHVHTTIRCDRCGF